MADRLLVIGATSAIAQALARRQASRGGRIVLVARDVDRLAANAADLRVRGAAEVRELQLDALDTARHAEVLDAAWNAFGGFDHVLLAHGTLPDQEACVLSVGETLAAFDVNARSVVALMAALAQRMELAGAGALAVLSSPAGDRGRASNYVYGAAKAAVTAYASGLRHRLWRRGVRVLTILPGFVDTPMTAAFDKSGPLWTTPERVAGDIDAALASGFGSIYTPWFWRVILFIVRHLPERVFVRTRL